jgi:hypothetical protein
VFLSERVLKSNLFSFSNFFFLCFFFSQDYFFAHFIITIIFFLKKVLLEFFTKYVNFLFDKAF